MMHRTFTRTLSLALLLVAIAGCRRGVGGPEAGAAASQLAVQHFLNAAKAGDIQAMSAVFGDEESPLRDRASRQETEQRMLIMACHLKHDDAKIGGGTAAPNSRTQHRVDLTQGTKSASPTFTTVRNTKTGRWFVYEFDLMAVRPFCGIQQNAPPAPTSRESAPTR